MICPLCGFDNLPGSETCNRCHQDLTQLDRPTAQDRIERSLLEDPVRVLESRPALTVPLTTTAREGIRMMAEANTGAVLVVDPQGRAMGIFTERDVLIKVVALGLDLDAMTLGELMSARLDAVGPDDSLAFALHKMDVGGYRHVPVLDDDRPLAMLSVRDMLRHFTRLCAQA